MRKVFFLLLFLFLGFKGFCSLAISQTTLQESIQTHIPYDLLAPNTVGHIYIGDHNKQINTSTYIYVKNALALYKEIRPAFIILELDTPGGEVFAAQKISDALKEMDIQFGIPIVAYINNWAISAGAMLAYSCRYIAVVKDGSMGAAQPISQTGEKTSEKVNSAIRADFANRAAFFDRNPLIAEAMVDPDVILVLRHDQIMRLNREEEIEKEDQVISSKGKLLTLNARQMIDLGVAEIFLPPTKLAPITAEEKEKGEWPASKELLFTSSYFQQIPNVTIKAYQMDWKTRFFAILSSSVVTSLLFLGLMICFYIELNTPGFGFPGVIGLICLFLILLSSFAVEAASWLELIILLAGVGLILLEVFVIPGFGFTGILGIILALIGLFALLLPGFRHIHFDVDTQTLNAAGQYVLERFAWLAATFVIGVILIVLIARWITPKLFLLSPLVLRGEQEAEKGYVAGLAKEHLPKIGSKGITVSPLRTAGKVLIEGEIYDAVSSGKFLEKGEKVRVIAIEGSKMIVEEEP